VISVHGTYQNGVVVLDGPVNLPEGAHVRVTLDDASAPDDDLLPDGRPWPKTPWEIEEFLGEIDAIPAMMTEREHLAWEAQRREEREVQKELFAKGAAEIARLFP